MAQPYYIPPDPWDDGDNANYSVWPNAGQVVDVAGNPVPDVAFYADGQAATYFQNNGTFSMVYAARDTMAGMDTLRRVDVSCAGNTANYPDPVGLNLRGHHANFYLPQCGPNGAANVQPFTRLIYPQVYPAIDLHVYSGVTGQKLAFAINPGGDPTKIDLLFQGHSGLAVDTGGNLVVQMAGAQVWFPRPEVFQSDSAGNTFPLNWNADYLVGDSTVNFSVSFYDLAKPLVIMIGQEPPMLNCCTDTEGLCWNTYYGGKALDYPKDVQADKAGNIYVAGRSESVYDEFPHFPGTSTNAVGTSVATLTKFNPEHELLWTIFHGGNTNGFSRGQGVAVGIKEDPARVYMVGVTNATDFLTQNLPGAYNNLSNSSLTNKGFVARYDWEFGTLEWSTYIGQSNVEVQGMDVSLGADKLVISGTTQSDLGLGNYLPPFGGYNFSANHGQRDAFVAVFNSAEAVEWSALYGGNQNEDRALVRCTNDDLVLAGNTLSSNLPVYWTHPASFHKNHQGGQDVFLLQFSLTGTPEWATYFGGPGLDDLAPQGMSLPRDLFLTGTTSGIFSGTLVNGAGWYDNVPNPGRNGFIARFGIEFRDPKWITYLGDGAAGEHAPYCIDAGGSGSRITIGGYTDDTGMPSLPGLGFYHQPAIVQDHTSPNGLYKDGFLVRFDNQQNLLWASYFGGEGGQMLIPENVTAVLNQGSSLYAVGCSSRDVSDDIRIPLDGTLGEAMFFNPLYNYDGMQDDYSDGFVTLFCDEDGPGMQPTGVNDPIPLHQQVRTAWTSPKDFTLLGLSDGPHTLKVYDAQGRVVLEQAVQSQAGLSEPVCLREQRAALYLLVVDNQRTGRLVPIR